MKTLAVVLLSIVGGSNIGCAAMLQGMGQGLQGASSQNCTSQRAGSMVYTTCGQQYCTTQYVGNQAFTSCN